MELIDFVAFAQGGWSSLLGRELQYRKVFQETQVEIEPAQLSKIPGCYPLDHPSHQRVFR